MGNVFFAQALKIILVFAFLYRISTEPGLAPFDRWKQSVAETMASFPYRGFP